MEITKLIDPVFAPTTSPTAEKLKLSFNGLGLSETVLDEKWTSLHEWCTQYRERNQLTAGAFLHLCSVEPTPSLLIHLSPYYRHRPASNIPGTDGYKIRQILTKAKAYDEASPSSHNTADELDECYKKWKEDKKPFNDVGILGMERASKKIYIDVTDSSDKQNAVDWLSTRFVIDHDKIKLRLIIKRL